MKKSKPIDWQAQYHYVGRLLAVIAKKAHISPGRIYVDGNHLRHIKNRHGKDIMDKIKKVGLRAKDPAFFCTSFYALASLTFIVTVVIVIRANQRFSRSINPLKSHRLITIYD